MRVAHILRKYEPAAWGGTETAILRLVEGLRHADVKSAIYCPSTPQTANRNPFAEGGCAVKRFHSFLPVAGISWESREQLVAWGGNLMSFDLPAKLLAERDLKIVHTHALNRLAGVAMKVARWRNLPLVITIHGGALDLPGSVKERLTAPLQGGVEWGKVFGLLLESRKVLAEADVVITCNPREAELLREKYPQQRITVLPHTVPAHQYTPDHSAAALKAFPQIAGRDVLLVAGRLDPVKNQSWLVEQMPQMLRRHPRALAVFVGSTTDTAYAAALRQQIENSGCQDAILLAGGLEPQSPEIIGMFQQARALVLPSTSETFGLVILEAWAAGTPVISSRTSGALSLVRPRENGWLFDLGNPGEFHQAVDEALTNRELRERVVANARTLVREQYDIRVLGRRVRALYEELLAAKRNGARP